MRFPAWLVIAIATILIAVAVNALFPTDIGWFNRQRRPSWLTFEWAIPPIWTLIFICGGWSAYVVWTRNPGQTRTWWLMGGYVLLELLILAYTPVMTRMRSLTVGTVVGGTGFLWGAILALLIYAQAPLGVLLLLPFLLWSPFGTWLTWQMALLNPDSR